MADVKISALSSIASVAAEDLIAIIDDPSGTPASRKATITQLATFLRSLSEILTNKIIDGDNNTITNIGLSESKAELKRETIAIAASDETTALTTGTGKITFRMPYAFTLEEVRASLTGAGSTSGTTTVDINESGTTILSTKLTIDQGEKTSETAAAAPVISDSSLADDAEITIDIDAVTGGADETGLKVYLIGYRT